MRLLVALLTIFLFACQPSPPAPLPAAGAAITGMVVERVDGAPYSYLRLKTEQGEVWAAVPMAEVAKGGKVTIKNGAPVKGFTAPGIGKKFEVVVFGLEPQFSVRYRSTSWISSPISFKSPGMARTA